MLMDNLKLWLINDQPNGVLLDSRRAFDIGE